MTISLERRRRTAPPAQPAPAELGGTVSDGGLPVVLDEHGWTGRTDDAVWLFELDDTYTPMVWRPKHLPSGVQLLGGFVSLTAAYAWSQTPAAVDLMRADARDRLHHGPDGVVDRAAMRQLVILDGNLAAGEPQAVCDCGGILTLAPGRRWMHVDLCWEAIQLGDGYVNGGERRTARDRVVCRDEHRVTHRMCLEPSPGQCEHSGCGSVSDLTAEPCPHGRKFCCGCCLGE